MQTWILRSMVLLSLFVGGCCSERESVQTAGDAASMASFSSDLDSGAVPWTQLNFADKPGNFHFAVVADRCGGHRPGVFETAMDRLNLLQPEFVMSVGDLIEGYTTAPEALDEMWSEWNGIAKRLTVPFFRVCGNHDVSNLFMRKYFEKKYGSTYYHFVYRNVLFLCLNSQDAYDETGGYMTAISREQAEYVRHVLDMNRGVRWTFVFMHQPLWLNEEGNYETARKKGTVPQSTGFPEIQKMLDGRDYTLITGHFHDYAKYERNGHAYYVLSTTGGANSLRGPFFGELDEVVWITMTDAGPAIADLSLGGIFPDNFRTEADVKAYGAMLAQLSDFTLRLERQATQLPEELKRTFENPYKQDARCTVTWTIPAGSPWSIEPLETAFALPAGQSFSTVWKLRCAVPPADLSALEPLPSAIVNATLADGTPLADHLPAMLGVDAWPYAEKRREMKAAVTLGMLAPASAPFIGRFTVEQLNPLDEPVVTTLSWKSPEGSGWTVSSAAIEMKLDAKGTKAAEFTASFDGRAPIWKRPMLKLETRAGSTQALALTAALPASLGPYMTANPIQLKVPMASAAPVIDGKLDDPAWASAARISEFGHCRTGEAAPDLTDVRLCYDADCLYVAARCSEPNMERLTLKARGRDSNVWLDDGIELFIDPRFDRQSEYQICVSASNVVYDSHDKDGSWNGTEKTAAVREAGAYTIEIAVPWATLGLVGGPKSGAAVGFNVARDRYTVKEEVYQWSPTLGSSHNPPMFGKLVLQ